MVLLEGTLKTYDWGSKSAIAELRGARFTKTSHFVRPWRARTKTHESEHSRATQPQRQRRWDWQHARLVIGISDVSVNEGFPKEVLTKAKASQLQAEGSAAKLKLTQEG